jgi:hypothetical protein
MIYIIFNFNGIPSVVSTNKARSNLCFPNGSEPFPDCVKTQSFFGGFSTINSLSFAKPAPKNILANYKSLQHLKSLGDVLIKTKVAKLSVLTLLLAVIVVSLFAGTVEAITNGVPDGNNHPYVCLIVFDDASGNPAWRGSGIVLSPTVVLTAGHCTDGAVAARVWVNEVVQGNTEYPYSGSTSYDGAPETNPDYAQSFGHGLNGFITHDVGIVRLSEPIPTSVVSTYGQLPTEGKSDSLKVGTKVDFVGYGVQENLRGGGQPVWVGLRNRFYAPGQILSKNFAISDEFLRCSANPGQGKGGTAFGDSGGPVLLAGTSTVLAVTSFGTNNNCAGNGYYYRIDQPETLSWINSYLS